MALPLKQVTALNGIAAILADILPYSGAFDDRGQITYRSIARELGVGGYWEKMSKTPGLARLMERILEQRRDVFEGFIIRSVKEGLRYREKNGRPVRRAEIEKLNGLIREVGFKFPELWDESFLAALDSGLHERARENLAAEKQAEKIKVEKSASTKAELSALSSEFYALLRATDRQAAGYTFEKILNRLFALSGLDPREPFKITGEQIDGSFELDHEIYLVEAKWEQAAANEGKLLVFRGKIEGKSQFTRGVFISLNGITSEAEQAITKGKQPNFFTVDGYDLSVVMQGHIGLADLFRRKLRKLAEEGRIRYSATEILDTIRK
jgi:Restriction endonuclease